MRNPDHLSSGATAVLSRVAHDEVRLPLMGEHDQIGCHHHCEHTHEDVRPCPRPPRGNPFQDAGKEFGNRMSTHVVACGKGAEARPFHRWYKRRGARERDFMPRRHCRPCNGDEWVKMPRELYCCEQDAHGNILPWVAGSRIGMLGSSNAHRIYLSGPMQKGWIDETPLNVRSRRRCPSHNNARNRVSGWGLPDSDRSPRTTRRVSRCHGLWRTILSVREVPP